MLCANTNCRTYADDLLKGTLKLMEFETSPDKRVLYSSGGFPVCSARTRFFWLCPKCSRRFTIVKWNASGVILERLPEYDAALEMPAARKTEPGTRETAYRRDRLSKTA